MAVLDINKSFGLVTGAPYIGSHLYQPVGNSYIYLTPPTPYQSQVLYHNLPHQQVINFPYHQQYVSTPDVTTVHPLYEVSYDRQSTLSHEELPEINQFHSEDADGRVLYGFHGHNQARMEARDSKGRVRGSYSYVDPHGHVVRMDYWDDGSGFQARGHNVPKIIYDFPTFTPEVQAAREEHFKLYQQILLSTIHAQPPNKIPEDDYPYIERPDEVISTPTVQDDEDDTVEVGLYPNNPNELPTYPMRIPGEIQRPSYPFQNNDEEDKESIALDNPELQDFGRGAKSLGTKDSRQEGSNHDDKVQQLGQNNQQETDQKMKTESSAKNDKDTDENQNESTKEEMTNNDNRHNGFSYQFQYKVGVPAKMQNGVDFKKVSSVVASEPIPKDQKTSVHSVHPLPLHTVTKMGDDVLTKSLPGPSAIHDQQTAPHQSVLQPPLIIKSFPSPVSAVHDPQVPVRKTSPKDTKTESRT